jgi:putative oxidoreductase
VTLKNLLFGGESISGVVANTGLAVLRIFTGLTLAFAHGLGKIPPSEGFIAGVVKLGFPMPSVFAWAAGLSELAGGLLLALGLATRPASFFVLTTMLVAGFVRHAADPFAIKEKAFLYAFIALLFVFTGAGKVSIDSLIRKK